MELVGVNDTCVNNESPVDDYLMEMIGGYNLDSSTIENGCSVDFGCSADYSICFFSDCFLFES